MTNNHVVAEAAERIEDPGALSDGRRVNAVLVGRSPSYDIAVIKASGAGSVQPLELGDSDNVQVGEQVIAVGSPLGLSGTVTEGIVSARESACGGQLRPVTLTRRARTSMPSRQTLRSIQAAPAVRWSMPARG